MEAELDYRLRLIPQESRLALQSYASRHSYQRESFYNLLKVALIEIKVTLFENNLSIFTPLSFFEDGEFFVLAYYPSGVLHGFCNLNHSHSKI